MAVLRTQLDMNSITDCSYSQSDKLENQVFPPKKQMFLADILNIRKVTNDMSARRIKRANQEFLKNVAVDAKQVEERVPKIKFGETELCFYNVAGEVKDQRILPRKIMSKTGLQQAFKNEKIAEARANVVDLKSSLVHLKGDDLFNTLDDIRRIEELLAIYENPGGPSFHVSNPWEDIDDVLEDFMDDDEIYELQNSFDAILAGDDDDFLSDNEGSCQVHVPKRHLMQYAVNSLFV